MSEFFKKFLMEDGRRLNPGNGRQVFLGAFGKHPGWDDHVEDLGLETESLIFAKKLIYVEGIGGQIDAGAWEKLDPAQQVPAFKHVFVWRRSGQFLIGRMWSSSDGKGRTRYPMVICAHCVGVPLSWALDQVLPRLESIERACLHTRDAADVRAILGRYRNELRNSLADVIPENELAPVSAENRARFLARPEFDPQKEGLFRILYQLQSLTPAFAAGKAGAKTDMSGVRAQQIRLPQSANSLPQTVLLWTRFFLLQIDPGAPLLLTIPLEDPWLDATLGEPGTQEMFCLRASPKSVPLANEIPYNLDAAFREKSEKFLAAFQSGADWSAAQSNPPAAPGSPGPGSGTQRWFKNLIGWGAVFLVVVAAVVWLVVLPMMRKDPNPQPQARITPPKTAEAAQPVPQTTVTPAEVPEKPATSSNANLAAAPDVQAAEAKRLADEKAAADAAQAKIEADAKETARLADEKVKQLADEQRLADEAKAKQLAEEKRLADEKAKAELAAQAAVASNTVVVAQAKLTSASDPGAIMEQTQPVKPQDGGISNRREITNGIGMELVWIEKMPGTKDGGYVGKYEVTQGQYVRVMASNPSIFPGDMKQPVENVSWNDAMDFCRKLTTLEKTANTLPPGQAYMLPTEAQWNFYLADARFDDAVTSRATVQKSPAPVGSTKIANKYGLYDVLGNVWEWCQDQPSPAERTLKGGAFKTLKTFSFMPMLETTPMKLPPDAKSGETGFRCVLAAQP